MGMNTAPDLSRFGIDANPSGIPTHKWREWLDFGDYCWIEQYRYGAENEWYVYKVIGRLISNGWVDTPVRHGPGLFGNSEVLHDDSVPVIRCVCCGVSETEIRKFRVEDVVDVPPRAKMEQSS